MKEEKLFEILNILEGLQTVDTVAEAIHIKKQSALNLIVKLKKAYYATVSGGGKQKRIYKITLTKQLPRSPGMFDIINKYNPHFKLNPWYDHQVHGHYGPEEALIDALQTKSFRVILASMRLYNHITHWPTLYKLAKEKDCWQQVGALYDVARLFFSVRQMPQRYHSYHPRSWKSLTQLKKKNFPDLSQKWKVFISFNQHDMGEIV